MKAVLHLAKRYFFSKNKRTAINIIFSITLIGIIVGALSLFTVLSGFSALKELTLGVTNQLAPDIQITSSNQKYITNTIDLIDSIKKTSDITFVSQSIEEKVLAVYEDQKQVVYLKGVDTVFVQQTNTKDILLQGYWSKSGDGQVTMGSGLALQLHYIPDYDGYNYLSLVVLNKSLNLLNPYGSFDEVKVINTGIYQTINEQANNRYLFTNLAYARKVLNKPEGTATSIGIWTDGSVTQAVNKLKQLLGSEFSIQTERDLNAALYKVIETEHLAVYLVFTFVLILASFNLSGLLIIVILDKRKDLQTLHNLGMTVKHIKQIFLLLGIFLSTLGGGLGIAIGILLVWLQKQYSLIHINAELVYPVSLTLSNVLLVLGTILGLGIVASVFASSRIKSRFLVP